MNLDIKNFLKNAFTKSKATLIAVGLTALIIFYLNATKTETEIVNAPEKLWPINAVLAEYKNTTPNLKLFGEIISENNSIILNNNPIGNLNPQQRREYLMAFSPEDRMTQAAIPQMKIFENVALNNFKSSNFFNNGLINEKKIKEHSQKILSDFSVNTNNVELKSQFLSGGNLQKLIIGRELITSPELLICFNPTWGLDVGAINYILLISTDTDELLKLCDKICVIFKGKLSNIMDAEEVTSEKLGILMGGGEIV